MPAFANIAILDSVAAVQTFSPDSQTGLEASYANRASGISAGFPRLKLSMTLAGRNQPLNKARVRFSIPKMETVSGSTDAGLVPAPRVAYIGSFDGTFIFHERSTLAERTDFLYQLRDLLANAQVQAVVQDLAPIY